MTAEAANSLSAFGFLTAIDDAQHGLFGGYLIVSRVGRPLEFHCTTPVLPNPAQKILFGASLGPYLLGDLIGRTLLEKAQLPVQVVLTDQVDMLSISDEIRSPMALLIESDDATERSDKPLQQTECRIGRYTLKGSERREWNKDTLASLLEDLVVNVALAEPFQRIREAIAEAQRITDPRDEPGDESLAAA